MSATQEIFAPVAEPVPSQASPTPSQIVFQAGFCYVISACLSVVCKLRIADLLGASASDVDRLAAQAGCKAEYLYRVLRVLESAGLFEEVGPGSFKLSEAGMLLRSEVPGSLAQSAEWLCDPLHLKLYSELLGTVRKGGVTFDAVYGEPFFPWTCRQENAAEAAVFNHAMTSISEMCVPAFLEAYDFSAFTHVIDVGGGHGALLRAVLKQNPRLQGTVAEMECLVPDARLAIAADGLESRCEAVPCDFFTAVPAGGDCYLMKHIVHDWEDGAARKLLSNIRAVIPEHGRLVLAEAVLDEGPSPHMGKLLDIEMMAFVGGKERTESEFRELLASAGFRLQRVVATKAPLSLVEAAPA